MKIAITERIDYNRVRLLDNTIITTHYKFNKSFFSQLEENENNKYFRYFYDDVIKKIEDVGVPSQDLHKPIIKNGGYIEGITLEELQNIKINILRDLTSIKLANTDYFTIRYQEETVLDIPHKLTEKEYNDLLIGRQITRDTYYIKKAEILAFDNVPDLKEYIAVI